MIVNAPLVTVLMPAFNMQEYILESIGSVLSQSFSDFELLIVNDCSTDKTLDRIASFVDPRIRLLSHPARKGIIYSLNRGLGEARGKYIARLDADDVAFPTRLDKQLAVFHTDPAVGLVATWTEVISEDGSRKGFGNWIFTSESIYYLLHFRNCLTHSSTMFEKALVLELGGYSENALNAEDYDLWRRISLIRKIVQLEEVLVKWRERVDSVTGRHGLDMQVRACRLAQQYISELMEQEYDLDVVRLFVDPYEVLSAEQKLLDRFAGEYPQIVLEILRRAPDYCRPDVLRKYLKIELAKYRLLLQLRGVKMSKPDGLEPTLRDTLLASLHYLSRRKHVRFLRHVITKSHF